MGIVDHAKDIAELIKKYNDQELYAKIIALREEIQDLREQNINLKEELSSLRAAEDLGGRLVRVGNCYYLNDDHKREKPYCLTCWDSDKKLVSLILSTTKWGTNIKCGICSARK